jgi:hypothetical protein
VRARVARPWRTVKREMEALYMLRLLECDEVEGTADYGNRHTVYRYSLDPSLDLDTLLKMTRLT